MCTVEILSSASVMRRSSYNGNLRPTAASICRRLFNCNTERNTEVLRKFNEKLQLEQKLRWNFDFVKENPLPGRYQWVSVKPVSSDRGSVSSSSVPASQPTTTGDADDAALVVAEVAQAGSEPVADALRCSAQNASSKQALITDFMSQKKRRRSDDSATSSKLKVRKISSNSNSCLESSSSATNSDATPAT